MSTPLSGNIRSNLGNPIPSGSTPTLTCHTISLSSAIDIEIEVVVQWSGQTFGLSKFTYTEPMLKNTTGAEVLTYSSTATLNASGTFYVSGQYSHSVVINPMNNRDIIQGTSATDTGISGIIGMHVYTVIA